LIDRFRVLQARKRNEREVELAARRRRRAPARPDFNVIPLRTSKVYGDDGSGNGRENHQPSAMVADTPRRWQARRRRE
jgi:hypothetical protein